MSDRTTRRPSASTALRGTLALAAAGALALTGCTTNSEGPTEPTGDEGAPITAQKDDPIAASVPQQYKDKGLLVIGTNPPYAPNEFKDSSGAIVGFDIDLLSATAEVMGLKTEYRESDFDKIIPSIEGGTLDMGTSSMTDNKEREKTVDFVTYFNAGVRWAAPTGREVNPDDACGLKVAVQRTTVEDTDDVPTRSAACTKAGKPAIEKVQFDDQDQAAGAVALGKVDAMSADSPVTAYAVKQSGGKLHMVGELSDAAPYGWPVKKGSPLAPVLQKALEKLISDGTYKKITEKWGVQDGALTTPKINGATS